MSKLKKQNKKLTLPQFVKEENKIRRKVEELNKKSKSLVLVVYSRIKHSIQKFR